MVGDVKDTVGDGMGMGWGLDRNGVGTMRGRRTMNNATSTVNLQLLTQTLKGRELIIAFQIDNLSQRSIMKQFVRLNINRTY